MKSLQKATLCIYHGNCADGFGAAWVVRKALGPDVEFVPGVYGQEPPDVTNKDVILVDFSYKYDVLANLSWKAHSIIVLDHHKSAAEDLSRFPPFHAGIELDGRADDGSALLGWKSAHDFMALQNAPSIACCFDMQRSGAMLAWDHFFPDQEPPQLLRHIEDRDLWLFKLEGTREIQANLFSYPYDFEVWDKLMAADVLSLVSDGAAIERKHHKDIAELVGVTKRRQMIGGYDVPVASLPYTLTSDAGALMAQAEPFAACYWDTPTGRTYSLRSTDDGIDVSEIASQYGGGGHRNASGFRVSFDHCLVTTPNGQTTTEQEEQATGGQK
ncbi:phosphohydrolase [Pseudomonas sp. PDM29]|uniref:phosphohydrolase n=1 Tax=Pseudomonas sp. PDM29 TaxID=2854771 RepID=UPI00210C15D5|nr:phosphohydrolase [Pseudomonas sp. PDM29]